MQTLSTFWGKKYRFQQRVMIEKKRKLWLSEKNCEYREKITNFIKIYCIRLKNLNCDLFYKCLPPYKLKKPLWNKKEAVKIVGKKIITLCWKAETKD